MLTRVVGAFVLVMSVLFLIISLVVFIRSGTVESGMLAVYSLFLAVSNGRAIFPFPGRRSKGDIQVAQWTSGAALLIGLILMFVQSSYLVLAVTGIAGLWLHPRLPVESRS